MEDLVRIDMQVLDMIDPSDEFVISGAINEYMLVETGLESLNECEAYLSDSDYAIEVYYAEMTNSIQDLWKNQISLIKLAESKGATIVWTHKHLIVIKTIRNVKARACAHYNIMREFTNQEFTSHNVDSVYVRDGKNGIIMINHFRSLFHDDMELYGELSCLNKEQRNTLFEILRYGKRNRAIPDNLVHSELLKETISDYGLIV